ncbi:MAG TPA: spermidine/putrescine ABC transporter substrate-binding protein [Thermoleophilaceae bacterium]|nr:spermidine/putrescine ABC transporter substrate-binding protein [Thermoleophilaceae bacterium]
MTERDIERLIETEISRRRLLRQAGAGVTALSFASFLAACGDDDGGLEGGGGDESLEMEAIPKGEVSDELNFSNWPLYIDVKGKRRPTLEAFEAEYGTKVDYTEEINDNTEFFGKVRQIYAQGDSGGRDLHVVTDWMASKMKQLGYVQKLDKSELPNVEKNLLDSLRSPSFDPNREFSVPWQSGMAAIIYRSDLVQPSSVNDLFDPKHEGKVTMLTEMRDTVGLVMLGMGMDPEEASTDEMLEAIEKIQQAQESGQIRRFTGNDYARDLLKGDVVMSVGWSGDAIQLQADNPDVKVLLPEEGFMLWSDNMQIPVGAPNAYTAQKFMDFVYQPEIAADIAAWVNYVTPVQGVQEILAKQDPELAENPLIFPSDADLERSYIFRELTPEEDTEVSEAFQRAIGA